MNIPELVETLTGRFNGHHAFLTRLYLYVIDQRSPAIADLTARIEVVCSPPLVDLAPGRGTSSPACT